MKNLFKKSLAFCLVTMLVLTAFVGAFSVSAESATVTAATVEVEAGTTTVTVPVEIDVEAGFYAAYIQVTSDFGALTAVEVPADADYDVTADGYTAVDLATGKILVMSIYGDDLRNDITSATVNCTFTAEAAPAAGSYDVVVTLPDVPAADWAESVVALTAANGAIVVTEEAVPAGPVEFVPPTYDVAANNLSLGYAAPNEEFKAALSAGGKTSTGRVVQIIVSVDGEEFPFPASITSGGGTFNISGFSMTQMNADVSIFIRVSNANTGYLWDSNSYDIVVAEFLADAADTDPKAAAWLEFKEAWAANRETFVIDADVEEGPLDVVGITYTSYESTLAINYGAPNAELKSMLSAGGKASTGRVVELVVVIDGVETAFNVSLTSGGGTLNVVGFSMTHYPLDLEFFIRISNASTDYLAETNSIALNLADVMASATDSAYAAAYAQYAAAIA